MKKNMTREIITVLLTVIIGLGIWEYRTVNKTNQEIIKVLNIDMPMEQAIREVEVSIWKTSNALFYYMTDPSHTSLVEYTKQLEDVEEFMNKYETLVDTEQDKNTVKKFMNIWTDVTSKAEELIKLRDLMTDLQEKAWDEINDVDGVIDYKIQVAFVEGIPDQIEKEKSVREVEVSIWEAINATNYLIHRQFDKPDREYPLQLEDVDKYWNKYKKLELTSIERSHIEEFEDKWGKAKVSMDRCLKLAKKLKEQYMTFWMSVHKADDVIDFEIQESLKDRTANRGEKVSQ